MNLEDKITLLKNISIFKGIHDEGIKRIAQSLQEHHYNENEIIMAENEEAESMFLVVYGSIIIQKGERKLAKLGSGDIVGEMSLLDQEARSASAVAATQSLLYEISRHTFQNILGRNFQTLYQIINTLSTRLRDVDKKLEQDYLKMYSLIHDIFNSVTVFSFGHLVKEEIKGMNLTSEKMIDTIIDSQAVLKETLNQALFQFREDPDNKLYVLNHTDLSDTIKICLDDQLAMHPDVKGREIEVDIELGDTQVPHNKQDMIRVINNLIINACQASRCASAIKVKAYKDSQHAILSIKDFGCGIPKDLQEAIFLPKFTTKENGSGIGLYSVKTIIEEYHKGEVDLVSEESEGCQFTLKIPLK